MCLIYVGSSMRFFECFSSDIDLRFCAALKSFIQCLFTLGKVDDQESADLMQTYTYVLLQVLNVLLGSADTTITILLIVLLLVSFVLLSVAVSFQVS